MRLLHSGHHEPLKAVVHGVGLVFCGVCAWYSVAALRARYRAHGRIEPHLVINGLIYTIGLGWEASHVRHHLACEQLDEGDNRTAALSGVHGGESRSDDLDRDRCAGPLFL